MSAEAISDTEAENETDDKKKNKTDEDEEAEGPTDEEQRKKQQQKQLERIREIEQSIERGKRKLQVGKQKVLKKWNQFGLIR